MKSQRVEFRAPEGTVPEGSQAGEDFDLVCTFRVKDSGQVCLVMMGDVKMPGYDARGESKPGYGDYARSMQADGRGGYPKPQE